MRGYDKLNFPAFHFTAARLRAEGHQVFSPAEKGIEAELIENPGLQHSVNFRRKVFELDLLWVCREAEAVAMLPGWEQSSGANAEHYTGKAIGLQSIILGKEYVSA
jgi:hypothetical protein